MKKLIIILTLTLLSNTYASTDLLSMLTPKELKMHECLGKIDKDSSSFVKESNNCLKGSEYYQSRTPSSASHMQIISLIAANKWFFSSTMLKMRFLKLMKKLNKGRKLINKTFKKVTHGSGVGVNGAVFFGIGASWLGEIMHHDGNIGLFCAPGISAQLDAGASIGVFGAKSLNCKSNKDYTGGFLTLAGGFNTEAIGLPFSFQLSYSLGADLKGLILDLKQILRNETFSMKELSHEIAVLSKLLHREQLKSETYSIPLYLGLKASEYATKILKSDIYIPSNIIDNKLPISVASMKQNLLQRQSLGRTFKANNKLFLQSFFRKNNLPTLSKFFNILDQNISGCDAVGGSAALAVSANIAFDASVTYSNYHLLYEIKDFELLSFKRLNAFLLLNPYLMGGGQIAHIAAAASMIKSIPSKIKNNCELKNILD